MSIFGSIMSKVLGRTPPSPITSARAEPSAQAAENKTVAPSGQTATTAPWTSAGPQVDVAAVLDDLKKKATQELDWRHSIVDLMKLLALDSSLAARKELARELHYGGDMNDSATMNVWLHKQIMRKEPSSKWRQTAGRFERLGLARSRTNLPAPPPAISASGIWAAK